jgi:hypothetical protein
MKRIFLTLLLPLGLFAQQPHNAIHFDGTDDYISTSGGTITGNNARTVEAWVRTDANCIPGASSGGKQQVVVDMGTFTNGARYTLNLLWANSVRIEVGGSGLSGTTAINDSAWHHIAAVYDPSSANKKHRVYINGILEASGNITTSVNTGSGAVVIGRRVDGVNPFEGDIDEVRIWDVALSDADIYAHFNNEVCGSPTNLKAYYTFNQGNANGGNSSNTTLSDQAGTNNGTLNNFSLSGTSSNWTIGRDMNPNYYDTVAMNVCNGMWSPDSTMYWDSTEVYRHTFTDMNGCDSVISYDLVVNEVDTSISVTASTPPTISSNAQGAMYQWVNCSDSSAVAGATQSFFVPSSNGDYAVIVTANGCSLWSQCVSVQGIGISEQTLVRLHPNPTSGILQVPSNWRGEHVEVSNLAGQSILSTTVEDKLDLGQAPAGVYVIRCGAQYARIIKE